MTRQVVLSLSLISFLSSAGCFLYIDDDDDGCDFGGDPAPGVPSVGQRNPDSGTCEFFGGGPFPCDDACGPCPEAGDQAPQQAMPSWAFCEDQCTGLDQASCLDATACRGIYDQNGDYQACWGTDMTGPINGGGCSGLDAYECSRHDDCSAVHENPCAVGAEADQLICELTNFIRCENENGTDPGLCYGEVNCDTEPPACPANTMPGISEGCWTGFCIPIDQCESQPTCSAIVVEASCIARVDCAPQYRGIDCTCDANGICTCASHEFAACSDV